jgi:Fur family ferric uptake transcriptional regulator
MEQSKDFGWFWEKLAGHLSKTGLKNTSQRSEIIEHFLKMGGHVSAEQLHMSLKGADSKAGLATVYRTMGLLKEAGLVDQKHFGTSKAAFEVHDPNCHHDHLICRDCGFVVEFENEKIEKLQRDIAKKHGFELVDHRLELWGGCLKKNCEHRKN